MDNVKSTATRFRNVSCIVYPESAPANWLDIIRDLHCSALISPLHDKDINPTDNEPKKAHYHVILMYDSVHTREFFETVISSFCGVGFEVVSNLRGYARYLCHLDNPEKAQYPVEQVVCVQADYLGIISLPSDKYRVVSEMISFCSTNGIIYYHELLQYARVFRDDWFRALCDNCTVVMYSYFRSVNASLKPSAPESGANCSRAESGTGGLSDEV